MDCQIYWKDLEIIKYEECQESNSVVLNTNETKEIKIIEPSSIELRKHKTLEIKSKLCKKDFLYCNKKVSKDLSTRLDVVNKTFIRSIKRYYDNIWCNKKRIKSHKNVSAVAEAWSWIDQICKDKFKNYFSRDEILETLPTFDLLTENESNKFQNDSSSKYSDVKLLVASMTMPDVLKVYMKTKSRKATFSTFSNVIYKYSHKNMFKLINNKTFKTILDQFVRSPDFEEILKTDETLKRFPDLYRQKGFKLIQ